MCLYVRQLVCVFVCEVLVRVFVCEAVSMCVCM